MKHFNLLMRPLLPVLLFLAAASPALAINFSGTYNIPSTTFPDLKTAIDQLNAGTVTGPTVFLIAPGTYTGSTAQGVLGGTSGAGIAGLSATNTVTFQSSGGTVTFSPAGTSTSNNFVFRLYNVNYITIKDLTLNNTGSTYGTSVEFAGNSSYNTVTNCILTGNTGTSTNRYKSRILAYAPDYGVGVTGAENVISNCTIVNASYGFYLIGSNNPPSLVRPKGWLMQSNTITTPYYGTVYCNYMDDVKFKSNTSTVGAVGTFYGMYFSDCDGAMELTGNTQAVTSASGTYYGIYKYYCDGSPAQKQLVANNTVTCGSSSGNLNPWYGNTLSYDSVVNNTFTATTSLYLYNYNQYCSNMTFKNNSWTCYQSGSYYTMYAWYAYAYGYGDNMVYDGNTWDCTGVNGGYVYLYACYYGNNNKFVNNNVKLTTDYGQSMIQPLQYNNNSIADNNRLEAVATSSGYAYPCYIYNNSTGTTNCIVSNNKIIANSAYYAAAFYHYYGGDNKIFNNAVYVSPNSTSGAYGLSYWYGVGKNEVYNNTVYNASTATANTYGNGTAAQFYNYSYYGGKVVVKNNIFHKASANGGGALMVYEDGTQSPWNKYHEFDYNNIYKPAGGMGLVQNYSPTTAIAADLASWVTATGHDRNSISYPITFMNPSAGDLRPDPSNSNCWAANGRGMHMPANDKDIAGNPRALLPGQGVPDLGAYEFAPNSGVLPPLCTVTPATPVAGGTQTYTFGQHKVATITWDAATTVPGTAPDCRQYSGVQPPGFAAFNNTAMYFYTDILTTSTADYKANIYFLDPWIGTIANKNVIRLAKKDGANPWVGYPAPGSGAVSGNGAPNYIFSPTTANLTTFGSYTGLDIINNAGAGEIVSPAGSFCAGTYTVQVKIKNLGSNNINGLKIDWLLDGSPGGPTITYSPTLPYNNGTPGSNEAIITLGNVTFGAAPRTIKVWTSMPNGVTDTYLLDDTMTVIKRSSLSGVYTVGGTTPDFPTPTAAVDALNQVGVCGPTTFNIRPGTYPLGATSLQINAFGGNIAANRVTFQSENGSASSVTISNVANGATNNGVFRLVGCNYITLRNLTIAGSTSTGNDYGSGIYGTNTSYDSVLGCTISAAVINSYSNQHGINFYGPGNSSYDVFIGNTIVNAGYGGFCFYGSRTNKGIVFNNNSTKGYMGIYTYGLEDATIDNNIVDIGGISNVGYAAYMYQCYGCTFTNNKVNGPGCEGAYYTVYAPYWSNIAATPSAPAKRNKFANNTIVSGKTGGSNYYAMYMYGTAHTDFYNNTVIDNSNNAPTTYYSIYWYAAGSYVADSVYNNVIVSTQGRYVGYFYFPTGLSHYMDYNNVYTSSTSIFGGTAAGTYTNFAAYRAGLASYGYEQNSISYNPEVLKSGMPDPSKPASWSMNGRGMQKASNTIDAAGNTRPTTRAAGVPDLGAYEFEPTAIPPTCAVTPALPAPGVTQTFTFGGTEVAVIKWNTQLALTSALNVRQYSGRVPPANFALLTGGKQMYFYTDIVPTGTGTTYDFNVTKLNYYDTWLGTTDGATSPAAELRMKLAEKVPTHPTWIVYNAANSATTNTAAPNGGYIFGPGITSFGAFTGVDSGLIFSALVKVAGSSVLCAGNSVTLTADPTSGGSTTYTYQWIRNGVNIPGANSSTYAATMGGDYQVTVTGVGSQSSTSVPVSITVVAPPMALISASGALTYCTGSNLDLKASSGGINYQWQLNGVDIPGATNQIYKVNGAGAYSVKVANIGCAVTSNATIVNAGPITVNLGTDINACELKNQGYILDAGYPGAKYLWSTGDTTQTITINSGSATYSVTVDAGPNCKGKDDVVVNLNPLPRVTGIGYQTAGDKTVFTAAGATNVDSYLWLFNDGTNAAGPSVEKVTSDNLLVKLVITNNCGSDTIQMMKWATGIANVSNELGINVYPNPAKDKVNISVTGAFIKDLSVMNSIGEVVYRAEGGAQTKTLDVNVSSFASGRYIIRANTTEGIISKPFNVQQQ